MNLVVLMGRLTKDPEIRYTQGEKPVCIATYTLAVDRERKARDGEPTADFLRCKAFGRQGEFAEKYMHKGERFLVAGRIETGSYTSREGSSVPYTEILVDRQEFAQAKGQNGSQGTLGASESKSRENSRQPVTVDDFISVPDGFEADLPFN